MVQQTIEILLTLTSGRTDFRCAHLDGLLEKKLKIHAFLLRCTRWSNQWYVPYFFMSWNLDLNGLLCYVPNFIQSLQIHNKCLTQCNYGISSVPMGYHISRQWNIQTNNATNLTFYSEAECFQCFTLLHSGWPKLHFGHSKCNRVGTWPRTDKMHEFFTTCSIMIKPVFGILPPLKITLACASVQTERHHHPLSIMHMQRFWSNWIAIQDKSKQFQFSCSAAHIVF